MGVIITCLLGIIAISHIESERARNLIESIVAIAIIGGTLEFIFYLLLK
ncbi:TPA: hypothetical protein ACG6RF_002055 [Streptococcus agalactiae]|nr:hypothetical protein [Streptococcus agalactiae]HEO2267432.1 hypothetical protein [Streptococcus agalactiae]HEO7770434.1 hypothetical protein [Streptococcus agalactiae]